MKIINIFFLLLKYKMLTRNWYQNQAVHESPLTLHQNYKILTLSGTRNGFKQYNEEREWNSKTQQTASIILYFFYSI